MTWVPTQNASDKPDEPGRVYYPRKGVCISCGQEKVVWMDEGTSTIKGVEHSWNPKCKECSQ